MPNRLDSRRQASQKQAGQRQQDRAGVEDRRGIERDAGADDRDADEADGDARDDLPRRRRHPAAREEIEHEHQGEQQAGVLNERDKKSLAHGKTPLSLCSAAGGRMDFLHVRND